MEVSVELFGMVFGALLSFLMMLPVVRDWYNELSSDGKQWFMIGGNLVIALVLVALACTGNLALLGVVGACEANFFVHVALTFFLTVTGNQSFYSGTKYIAKKRQLAG